MQTNRRLTPYELLWEEALEPLNGFHVPEDAVCDVIMRCGGVDFDVHSEVLAASSPVFNEVLAEYNRQGRARPSERVIEFGGCDCESMRRMISSMYNGAYEPFGPVSTFFIDSKTRREKIKSPKPATSEHIKHARVALLAHAYKMETLKRKANLHILLYFMDLKNHKFFCNYLNQLKKARLFNTLADSWLLYVALYTPELMSLRQYPSNYIAVEYGDQIEQAELHFTLATAESQARCREADERGTSRLRDCLDDRRLKRPTYDSYRVPSRRRQPASRFDRWKQCLYSFALT